jgi:hydrogenase/urease accessory protein HupE
MIEIVYALCALASLFCALLLVRSYWKTRVRLVLWASLTFVGLALNNALLFIDLVVVPSVDLGIARSLTALIAVLLLAAAMSLEET